jgi:hypothetical protein
MDRRRDQQLSAGAEARAGASCGPSTYGGGAWVTPRLVPALAHPDEGAGGRLSDTAAGATAPDTLHARPAAGDERGAGRAWCAPSLHALMAPLGVPFADRESGGRVQGRMAARGRRRMGLARPLLMSPRRSTLFHSLIRSKCFPKCQPTWRSSWCARTHSLPHTHIHIHAYIDIHAQTFKRTYTYTYRWHIHSHSDVRCGMRSGREKVE